MFPPHRSIGARPCVIISATTHQVEIPARWSDVNDQDFGSWPRAFNQVQDKECCPLLQLGPPMQPMIPRLLIRFRKDLLLFLCYHLHPVGNVCNWLYFLQMVDRPSVADQVLGQFYVQPQWVFDSINRFRIPTVSRLFAHLSRPWSNGWVALSFLFVRRPSRYGDIFSSSTST